jgi:DNA-binding MarR family transcriptional regulator
MDHSVSNQIGYELKHAQHALRLKMDEALRDLELTAPQYAALSVLADEPGLSSATLARRCFVTPQTMNSIVKQLKSSGMIERQQHPAHGRILQTTLTDDGQRRVLQAHQLVSEITSRMVATLAEAQQQQLLAWLRACSAALGS